MLAKAVNTAHSKVNPRFYCAVVMPLSMAYCLAHSLHRLVYTEQNLAFIRKPESFVLLYYNRSTAKSFLCIFYYVVGYFQLCQCFFNLILFL